jgi:hypothetical protein
MLCRQDRPCGNCKKLKPQITRIFRDRESRISDP